MAVMTRTMLRVTRLRDGSEEGNADMMNGALTKTKARTMLTRWCYLCYKDKDTGGVAGAAKSAPTPACKPEAAAALEACWLAESTGSSPEAATARRPLVGITVPPAGALLAKSCVRIFRCSSLKRPFLTS